MKNLVVAHSDPGALTGFFLPHEGHTKESFGMIALHLKHLAAIISLISTPLGNGPPGLLLVAGSL